MQKILFLIHDLGQGGAEKVLVNLVNNLDRKKFDISVVALFGGGVNEKFLDQDIDLKNIFPKQIPGNSKLMKILTPETLHALCVKDDYDIEVSYLEGPSARIISGCQNPKTKLVCWIHGEQHSKKNLAASFRDESEAKKCYDRFDKIICVSQSVKQDFCSILQYEKSCDVLYNTIESEKILRESKKAVTDIQEDKTIKLVAVGTLKEVKGYDRLLRIMKRLHEEKYSVSLYILGIGPLQSELEQYVCENNLKETVHFLGYQTNPYKFVARCDLFVCSSYREGFSTAATEALIVGTPVCTVEVSGMREMLGDSQYGLITENAEESLYQGIKELLDHPDLLSYYKKQAEFRGKSFCTEKTVEAVENMFLSL